MAKYNDKTFLGTVVTDNKYKGRRLLVKGSANINSLGLSSGIIITSLLKGTTHRGCVWTLATPEEIEEVGYDIDQTLLYLMVNDRPYMDARVRPVIAEVIDGANKGFKFALYGTNEITANGFNKENVSSCAHGRLRTHKGCTFRYGTHKEAEGMVRGLPRYVRENLVTSRFSKYK